MIHKLREWGKRYLPAEVFATIGALAGAGIVYYLTGNGIAAAYAGTIFENIGYYGYISFSDIKNTHKAHKKENKKYGVLGFLKNLRNIVMEFGPAEFLDSLIIRPLAMWYFPILLGNFPLGIIIGKFAADIVFYIPTIISYELMKKLK